MTEHENTQLAYFAIKRQQNHHVHRLQLREVAY